MVMTDILTAARGVFHGHNEGITKVKEVLDTVMNIYVKTMTEDDDKEVVAQACMSTADMIKDLGYIAVEPYMPRLVEATLVLLWEESACQQIESDSEIDDDDAKHDEVLMDAVSDLLPAFAKAMGYYGDVLRGLHPLFGESEPDNAARDNAAGAVARMIMVHPESIPLNQVLPVFLRALPLKEDHEESMTVYSCLCNLVLSSNAQILSLVPELITLFAQVASSPVEPPEVKAQIGRAFSHLMSLYGHQMQPLLGNLSPTHANALAATVPKS
ncbi:hypothetical protein RJ639_007295 [Escallonia herrerae]|uniref:Uncharacterized protein n=1 Tax=Escallonia herrerae TaxID=1293975 RepID=A0AA88VXQ5_9ASTE|nr:hypothetical protein RJ639_007295 [Escallonia herrerae]